MAHTFRRCGLSSLLILLGLFACQTQPPAPPAAAVPKIFNIETFGAVPDGKTPATLAIQKALDACGAAGGGQVIVPAGTFFTAPLSLRSGVDLHLEAGALLTFSKDHKDYPLILSSYEGKETYICQPPIWGQNLTNVSITGPGAIDGQGQTWRTVKRSKLTDQQWNDLVASGGVTDDDQTQWWPSDTSRTDLRKLFAIRAKSGPPNIEDYRPLRDLLRPNLILLADCTHVLLQDATFRNSGSWDIHLLDSSDIAVRHITVHNELWAQNGDGIDVDSCANVLIENSTINAGDDDICLKSGRDEAGRLHARPTQHVIVRNCEIGWGHGGIAIGSETSGGIRDVDVYNCTLTGTDIPIRFKTVRGRGGVVEDIHIHNIAISKVTNTCILFDMYYQEKNPKPEPVSVRTPIFRDITIRDVICYSGKRAINVRGLPELPMNNITLENVRLNCDGGASFSDGRDFVLRNVSITSRTAPALETYNIANLTLDHVDAVVQAAGTPQASAKETAP
ncbi:MAG: glycoside hydrolase family 28 protein [Tepidisphaeraceae bacterium]|jgi:DNA sulfur modification protein DndE